MYTKPNRIRLWLGFVFLMVYNKYMLRTRNLTLNETAQELTIDDIIDTPCTVSIQNTDASASIYIGNVSVTTSNYGIKLVAGQIWSADLGANDKIYAVGTASVAVMILER